MNLREIMGVHGKDQREKNTKPEKASINQAKTVYGLQGWPALGA